MNDKITLIKNGYSIKTMKLMLNPLATLDLLHRSLNAFDDLN